MKEKSLFERYLLAIQNTGDIMLRWQFQKDMMKQSLYERQEREQLVHDAASEVLSRLSATVDASEIFDAIDDLEDRLNDLGK